MSLSVDLTGPIREAMSQFIPTLRDDLIRAVRAALADRLVGVDEAAEINGCTPAAMRKKIQRGAIQAVRHGRSVRVRLSDLLAHPDTSK